MSTQIAYAVLVDKVEITENKKPPMLLKEVLTWGFCFYTLCKVVCSTAICFAM